MSDVLLLYLFTRLDALIGLGAIGAVMAVVTGFGAMMFYSVEHDEMYPHWRKHAAALAAFVALIVITPSKSDMAIIVGGKIALDAARSDTGQEIAGEVVAAIRAQLKEAAK